MTTMEDARRRAAWLSLEWEVVTKRHDGAGLMVALDAYACRDEGGEPAGFDRSRPRR